MCLRRRDLGRFLKLKGREINTVLTCSNFCRDIKCSLWSPSYRELSPQSCPPAGICSRDRDPPQLVHTLHTSHVVLMRETRVTEEGRMETAGKNLHSTPTKSWRPGSPQITNYLHGLQNKRENNFPEVQVQDKPPLKCPQQENKGLCLLDGQTQTDAAVSLNKGRETDDAAGNFLCLYPSVTLRSFLWFLFTVETNKTFWDLCTGSREMWSSLKVKPATEPVTVVSCVSQSPEIWEDQQRKSD